MGKQKIERLLAQLQENTQTDVQNAAAIFTVAQGTVNQLSELSKAPAETADSVTPTLLASPPADLKKQDLVKRYGSYNGCRSAAKRVGITFSGTPTWDQLIAGFSYLDSCEKCVRQYLEQFPQPKLKGIRITLSLDT